jgi:acetoin utilization protein AcuC
MNYAFIYDPALSKYELSDSHPFKPIRLELTKSLLESVGLLKSDHIAEPYPISETQLLRIHDKDFVDAVKTVSKNPALDDAYDYGLGTSDNPIFPNMHEAIMRVCSATTTAVHLVASGKVQRAVNLSGGLHHAHANKASGFCIYNDLAVAIDHAVKKFKLRVAYVDIDAHHGDGVQGLFYDRADVMTISLHESGRYLFPGTGHTYEIGKDAGRGYSVNMPLEPFSEDSSYLEAFEAIVPSALRIFKPDLIVLQAGADMHRHDPLADLALTVQGISKSYQRMSELADELCEGRLVATGGGGYDPYRTVPRAWAQLWAAVSRQTLPAEIPDAWREKWSNQSPVELPRTFADDTTLWQTIPRRSEIESHNRAVVKRLVNTLESTWGEKQKSEVSSQNKGFSTGY